MPYIFPDYITNQGQPSPLLRYLWDDFGDDSIFRYDPTELIEKIENVTTRAKIALCIGIYEWIIWRYHRLTDDASPFQIAEAAWCGNIHNAYPVYFELDPDEYAGPVRDPLYNAMMSIGTVLSFTDENEDEWVDGLALLAPLAMHILPDTKPFEEWLESVTDRLLLLYPAPEDDPYEDIFNDHEEERRGLLVAREALDPSFDYHPDQAPELLDNFLRNVDHTANPFLRSPEELKESGIEHPYQVLPPESPEWRK
ncbi:MAG: hypothetical protein FWG14_14295 [Peptococcaceae bacterium]|nr:hypothetical protein [Peptococcaceae bacterium]